MLFIAIILMTGTKTTESIKYEAYYADKEACLTATSKVVEELNEDKLYRKFVYTCTPKRDDL